MKHSHDPFDKPVALYGDEYVPVTVHVTRDCAKYVNALTKHVTHHGAHVIVVAALYDADIYAVRIAPRADGNVHDAYPLCIE